MPRLSALAFSMGTYGLTRGVSGFGAIYRTQQIFTGSTTFTVPDNVTSISEYLVLGGGGGGGYSRGAGGGAGGMVTGTDLSVSPGASITVTVGGGGDKGTPTAPKQGSNGVESVFGSVKANGGGGGGGENTGGLDGGCGGGAASGGGTAKGSAVGPAPLYTKAEAAPVGAGQGFDGGTGGASSPNWGGAGGGGVVQRGGNAGPNPVGPAIGPYKGGHGGNGTSFTLTGNVLYDFGGGGAGGGQGNAAQDHTIKGLIKFGGGIAVETPYSATPTSTGRQADGREFRGAGGAGSFNGPGTYIGQSGSGGSGVVIIKYDSSTQEQVFVFNNSQTFTVPEGKGFNTLEYLVVSGGGGGGKQYGGGGGAGGLRTGTGVPISEGQEIIVSVGSGGGGAPAAPIFPNAPGGGSPSGTSPVFQLGTQGGHSFFKAGPIHVGTNGGGYGSIQHNGGTPHRQTGGSGGCGGGGSNAADFPQRAGGAGDTGTISSPISGENTSRSPVVQGFPGGHGVGSPESGGGGGGGATGRGGGGYYPDPGAGDTPAPPFGSNGGNSFISSITGIVGSYAGGGGGGTNNGGSFRGGAQTEFRYGPTGTEPMAMFGSNAFSGNGGGGKSSSPGHPPNPGSPKYQGPLYTGVYEVQGMQNTGGGGGAGSEYPNAHGGGANGGSGIVILKLSREE